MSAFEADRFNHSRTSPDKRKSVAETRDQRLEKPTDRTGKDQQLTTAFKERLQYFRTTPGQYSAANFNLVVQLRMIQHLRN
jgi:hypothetical protein